MSVPKIDRAKTWLDQSGLKQTNMPLWQVLIALIDAARAGQIETANVAASSGGGGSTGGITALTTDVVATGPGIVPAIIQPNAVTTTKIIDDAVTTDKILDEAVTYVKIQETTLGDILLGRSASPGVVEEISLGADLEIVGTTLEIIPGGGGSGGGIAHNFLSATHPDTVPASPVIGDIVRAVEGPELEGDYYGFTINALVVEDFSGIRFGAIFSPAVFVGNYFGYYATPLSFISFTPLDTLLAWEYIDFFIQSLVVEDFSGIRTGYTKTFEYLTGNNFAYYPPALTFIAPPSPANPDNGALWERLPTGSEDDVLTIVDGLPEWAPIPTIEFPDQSWVDIPFDAGDFTASGGTTPGWTVASGNVERWNKQYSFNELGIPVAVRYALYLRSTTVSGTAPTQLQIAIPDIIIGRFALFTSMQENNVAQFDTFVEYDDSISTIQLTINKIAGVVFDTTAAETFVAFEISAVLAP